MMQKHNEIFKNSKNSKSEIHIRPKHFNKSVNITNTQTENTKEKDIIFDE